MNPHIKGSLLITLSMLLFAFQAIFIQLISLDTMTLLAYYELTFLILLSAFLFISDKKSSFRLQHPKLLLLSSVILLLGVLYTYYTALRTTNLANTMFTHYTAPLFAFIVAVAFLKEKFEWKSVFAIVLSMAGILLIFRNGTSLSSSDMIGMIYGLISGLLYGILINVNKSLVNKGNNYSLIFYQTLPLVIILSPFLFFSFPTFNDFIFLVLMALIPGISAAAAYFKGLQCVKAQHAGIISYTEIAFVIILGMIFFGKKEMPDLIAAIGGILIIVSGIWIMLVEGKSKKKHC